MPPLARTTHAPTPAMTPALMSPAAPACASCVASNVPRVRHVAPRAPGAPATSGRRRLRIAAALSGGSSWPTAWSARPARSDGSRGGGWCARETGGDGARGGAGAGGRRRGDGRAAGGGGVRGWPRGVGVRRGVDGLGVGGVGGVGAGCPSFGAGTAIAASRVCARRASQSVTHFLHRTAQAD